MLGLLGVVAVPLAVLLRGGLLLNLFGIGVQHTSGAPASRWRCGARSLVAWSPLLVLLFWTDAPLALRTALELVVLVGAALSVYRPDRGPADRIVGTVLVPK